MSRARRWCGTLNNPTEDVGTIQGRLCQLPVVRGIIGDECGESGTRHYQFYIEFRNCVSLRQLKGLLNNAHFEIAKGDAKQNYDYCRKDGKYKTFPEGVDFPSRRQSAKGKAQCPYPDLLRGLLGPDRESYRNLGLYLRNKNTIDSRLLSIRNRQFAIQQYTALLSETLRPWQLHVLQQLATQSDRKVCWVYSTVGGEGKSWFARYLKYIYQFDLFDGITNAAAVSHMLSDEIKGVVFDVTRSNSQHFSYGTLESVKDGFIMSWKWAGHIRAFKSPIVLVLCNFYPEKDRLSGDRWQIINLDVPKTYDEAEKTPAEILPIPPCPSDPLPQEEQQADTSE